jgi:hypothetical protein
LRWYNGVEDSRRRHQCFCREAGFIDGPPLKTLKGKRLSFEADLVLPTKSPAETQAVIKTPADTALPPPQEAGPPTKR